MTFRTISNLAANHPNTFMEQFCKALHPELELGTICVTWYRQATKHCSDLLSNAKAPTAYFWATIKNFIFPDRSTEKLFQKLPIRIHPKRLSMQDCLSLFLDIIGDYVQKAPRYSAESTTNIMLWQLFYSFLGTMIFGSFLACIIYAYNKYGQPKVTNHLEEVFNPEKRMQAIARRSLRLSKTELRNIHIKPLANIENIMAANGTKVLAIKVGTKYEVLESLIEGCMKSRGKFYGLHERGNKTNNDFKVESIGKAMKFLDNNCKKLHLILMFEDDVGFEENSLDIKSESINYKTKHLSKPSAFSSRIFKDRLNTRLESASASLKPVTTVARSNMNVSLTRPASPKLSSTPRSTFTPRSSSSAVANYGTARNSQRSPLTK